MASSTDKQVVRAVEVQVAVRGVPLAHAKGVPSDRTARASKHARCGPRRVVDLGHPVRRFLVAGGGAVHRAAVARLVGRRYRGAIVEARLRRLVPRVDRIVVAGVPRARGERHVGEGDVGVRVRADVARRAVPCRREVVVRVVGSEDFGRLSAKAEVLARYRVFRAGDGRQPGHVRSELRAVERDAAALPRPSPLHHDRVPFSVVHRVHCTFVIHDEGRRAGGSVGVAGQPEAVLEPVEVPRKLCHSVVLDVVLARQRQRVARPGWTVATPAVQHGLRFACELGRLWVDPDLHGDGEGLRAAHLWRRVPRVADGAVVPVAIRPRERLFGQPREARRTNGWAGRPAVGNGCYVCDAAFAVRFISRAAHPLPLEVVEIAATGARRVQMPARVGVDPRRRALLQPSPRHGSGVRRARRWRRRGGRVWRRRKPGVWTCRWKRRAWWGAGREWRRWRLRWDRRRRWDSWRTRWRARRQGWIRRASRPSVQSKAAGAHAAVRGERRRRTLGERRVEEARAANAEHVHKARVPVPVCRFVLVVQALGEARKAGQLPPVPPLRAAALAASRRGRGFGGCAELHLMKGNAALVRVALVAVWVGRAARRQALDAGTQRGVRIEHAEELSLHRARRLARARRVGASDVAMRRDGRPEDALRLRVELPSPALAGVLGRDFGVHATRGWRRRRGGRDRRERRGRGWRRVIDLQVPRVLHELDRSQHVAQVVLWEAVVVVRVELGPHEAHERARAAIHRIVGHAQRRRLGRSVVREIDQRLCVLRPAVPELELQSVSHRTEDEALAHATRVAVLVRVLPHGERAVDQRPVCAVAWVGDELQALGPSPRPARNPRLGTQGGGREGRPGGELPIRCRFRAWKVEASNARAREEGLAIAAGQLVADDRRIAFPLPVRPSVVPWGLHTCSESAVRVVRCAPDTVS